MSNTDFKRRSTITYYIDRLAEGDITFKDRLCQRLADRLLHIPLQSEEQNVDGEHQEVIIKVRRITTSNGVEAVPVFSNRPLLEAWCHEQQVGTEDISIIGADLCKVLEPELWLVIDPNSEAELLLHPESVQRIAEYGEQALQAEFGEKAETKIVEVQEDIAEIIQAAPPVIEPDVRVDNQPEQKEQLNQVGLRSWLGL